MEGELYDVPGHQKPPPSGTRLAALRELVPQLGAVTVGYVAAPALLASLVLAGGDGLDASTLSFLGGQAVLEQEEEEKWVMKEEARRRQEERLEAQVAEECVELVDERTGKTYFWNTSTSATSWTRPSASSSSLPGRKRKKKKKKKKKKNVRRRRRTTKWTS